MSATATDANVETVKAWYESFLKQDLDAVVSRFAENAIVIIGAADSEGYVPYGGRFVGKAQIKHYYSARFMRPEANPMQIVRPLCGLKPFMQEFGRWVIVGGTIKDSRANGADIYDGRYLHVWSINPEDGKFASLSMFFDPADVRA